ncbi:MAG: diguanylate cyclase [Planctomycetota bacterium]
MPTGFRVLIIDDCEDQRLLLERRLSQGLAGSEVIAVESLKDGLAAIAAGRPDCVLLDYNLGAVRAEESLPAVREALDGADSTTPIVMTSASRSQEVAIRSFRLGVRDFLPKEIAFEPGRLVGAVRAVMTEARREAADRRRTERERANLRELASRDELTGLLNRRGFERSVAATMVAMDRRHGFKLAIIDIDRFKAINDTFGHGAGDAILRRVATAIRDGAGPRAVVARWGGEEFVALHDDVDSVTGFAWAQGIRERVKRTVAAPDGRPVTVSIGTAARRGLAELTEVIDGADTALYMAKNEGRDRVRTQRMTALVRLAERCNNDASEPLEALRLFEERAGLELGGAYLEHCFVHGRRVAARARAAAASLALGASGARMLVSAALCHDIGKAIIPAEVLDAARALSVSERVLVDAHAELGASLAAALGFDDEVVALVRHHHTPARAGDELRSLARVLASCDRVTAMLEGRPYSPGKTAADALREELSLDSSDDHHRLAGVVCGAEVMEAVRARVA